MLTLARNLLKKTKDNQQVKCLTVCFWTDFMNNPSVMYGLFLPTPLKLTYSPDRVILLGTESGMINQIIVSTVDDMELFHEEVMGLPILLRIWVKYSRNEYIGASHEGPDFENDMALLVDTSHPMIYPEFQRGLEWAKKSIQSKQRFCLQFDFGPSIERWLTANYPQSCYHMAAFKGHQARLYITNYQKPRHCFDCNTLWCSLFGACWLFSAPCYKVYRRLHCKDLVVQFCVPVVRRTVLPNGTSIEVSK